MAGNCRRRRWVGRCGRGKHMGCRDGSTIDPGVGNANMASVLDHAETRMIDHMSAMAADCNGCSASVSTIYSYPGRSLKCHLESDYVPLFGLVPEARITSEAVVRLEFQRCGPPWPRPVVSVAATRSSSSRCGFP